MKIAVIGGGASGVLTSIFSKRNNDVVLFERNSDVLKKLLITGNGKCNYFNETFSSDKYVLMDDYNIDDIITKDNADKILSFFEKIGIVPKIKNGYYYPFSEQSISIKNALKKELSLRGVNVLLNTYVKNIKKDNDKFIVETDKDSFVFDKVVVSCGSMAYPRTGSDGNGYNILKLLGHSITKVGPGLVQIKTSLNIHDLKGVRSDVLASLYKNDVLLKEECGQVQFIEDGLSGICVFNLSLLASKYEYKNLNIVINFVYNLGINNKDEFIKWFDKKDSGRTVLELLEGFLNYKIANKIIKIAGIKKEDYFANLSSSNKEKLAELVVSFKIPVSGVYDYSNSQITIGGVPLKEININTMESKICKGLFITGEILDVSGFCGGYNLGFAFLSGILAGSFLGGYDD